MRIASWNVNSLRVRLPQVLDWLASSQVDVLGLQETKTQDPDFPTEAINEAGYDVIFSGQKTYNGVALLAKRDTVVAKYGPMHNAVFDLPALDDPQRRVIFASLGELRIANLYIPNGSAPGTDKYDYKLKWLNTLLTFVRAQLNTHEQMVIMGDFNIAPSDEDVYDPQVWQGQILVSPAERKAFADLLELGFCDSFRQFPQKDGEFSWWDYRAASFRRNLGVRIDIILSSTALQGKIAKSWIDRVPRGWTRPSDHAPVVTEFTL